MNALTCSDNYDIVFTDSGNISVESEVSSSVANMLKLDFISNDDWGLDSSLGLHWMTSDNKGLLQLKNNDIPIINAIQRKLMSLDGVAEVTEIDINETISRRLILNIKIKTTDGKQIQIRKEV